MPNKYSLLIAQALITLTMAFSMSGIMGFIALGPTPEWLASWPKSFIIAWPIAFCLTLPVGRIAFAISGRLTAAAK
ncbi:DUF2798 domain-containing protein [Pelagibacterium sp.]|uniref:DUF2798 domain-containing protein n=1 Tax=Pelagibacterium sp. TaxID=1967288 RepID=UPI003BAD2824